MSTKAGDQYYSIFHANRSVMLIIDPENGQIIDANKAALNFYGFSHDNLISMSICEINILSEEAVRKEMELAVKEAKNNFHFQHQLSSGEIRHVDVYSGIIDFNNRPVLCSVIHDITDRIETQHALKERNKELRVFYEVSNLLESSENNLEEILNKIVSIMPGAMQYPDICMAKIEYRKKIIVTPNYKNSSNKIWKEFLVNNKKAGTLEVIYPENAPDLPESHFIPEEQDLVNAIGERIGKIIERKLNEEKLKISEKRLELAIKGSNDAPWDWDLESGKVYFSSMWWMQVGYEPDKSIENYQFWESIIHPEDLKNVKKSSDMAMASNNDTYEIEYRVRHKKGHYITILSRGFITRDQDSKAIRVTGTNMDLTNRNKSLIESEEKHRLLAQNMIDLVALHYPDGRYSYLSPSVEKVLGYKVEELIGTSPYDLFHPDDIPVIQQNAHQKALQGEVVNAIEYRIKNKYGEYRWFNSNTNPVFDGQGQLIQLQTVSSDITDRKIAELKIRENERKLRAAEKIAHIGNYEINIGTGKACWSEETFRIFGMDPEKDHEPTVSEYEKLVYIEDREKLSAHFSECVAEKKDFNLVYRIIRKDGEMRYVQSIGIIKQNTFGEDAMFGTFQDITNHKLSEDALKKSEQKQRELNATKDKLFSIIGHDLKSPINSIVGFSSLIEKKYDKFSKEKMKELNHLIFQSSLSFSRMLDNLLTWSISQSQHFEITPNTILLHPVVEECFDFLRQVSEMKQISLTNNLSADTKVFADENMINTVLRNLLSNAIKFSEKGGTVSANAKSEGDNVIIEICDQGVGIEPDKIESLFHISENRTTSGTDGEKGTGLGLIICKDFILKNRGEIRVESIPGKGSSFFVKLPSGKG